MVPYLLTRYWLILIWESDCWLMQNGECFCIFSAISWWEQVIFPWDNDNIYFVLDHHPCWISLFFALTWPALKITIYCIRSEHANHYNKSQVITVFVTGLTRRVPLVEQELLTLPDIWAHTQFLVGFRLLNLQLYVYVL